MSHYFQESISSDNLVGETLLRFIFAIKKIKTAGFMRPPRKIFCFTWNHKRVEQIPTSFFLMLSPYKNQSTSINGKLIGWFLFNEKIFL